LARLTPEEIARMNALLDQQMAKMGEINDLTDQQVERYSALQTIQEQVNEAQSDGLTSTELKYQNLIDAQKQLNEEAKGLSDEMTTLQEILEENKDLTEEQKEEIFARKEAIEKEISLLAEQNRLIAKRRTQEEASKDYADGILQTFFGITKNQHAFVGQIQESVKGGKSLGGALADVGKRTLDNVKNGLKFQNIAASMASKIIESTIKMVIDTDAALANFNEMTTAGGELNEMIFKTSMDTKEFGIGMKETVQAAQELYTSMSGFTELTSEAQGSMLELAAGMEKAGVSANDTGKLFDTAMKGFGMTVGEAENLSKELLATSQALNVPAGQLTKNFNSAMNELAKYGPDGIKVFKGLSAQAKAAGVEMSTLLSVASQFDTIEGAASATASLNAILGSNINTMEMLNATEEDRIALLQQAVNATGKSFDEMDRFEKQAIASAAGISDMSEAAKLFNAETAAFGAAADSMDEIGAAQADMAAATSAATSIGEKLTLMFEMMAVAVMPIITVLNDVLEVAMAVLKPIMDVVIAIIDFAIKPFVNMIGMIKEALEPALDAFGNLGDVLSGLFEKLGKMSDGFSETDGIMRTFKGALAVVGDALAFVINIISLAIEMVGGLVGGILSLVGAVYELSGLSFIFNMIADGVDLVSDAFDALNNAFGEASNIVSDFFSWAKGLGQAMVDGISEGLSNLRSAIAKPFVDAWSAVTEFFGFASPAKIADDLGVGLVDGMIDGLGALGDNMYETFVSAFDLVNELIAPLMEWFQPILDVWVEGFKMFFNFFAEGLNMIISGLNMVSFDVPDFIPGIGGESFGIDIPLIPLLEEGGMIEKDGAAFLHKGEEVIPAAEVSMLDKATSFLSNPSASGGLMGSGVSNDDVVAAIKEQTAAIRALAGAGSAGGDVVLELNERELGRAVTKALNDRNQMTLG
jgi:phage-related protein